MARGTSKKNDAGRAKPSSSADRKRATRPPIIDVTATEIPNAKRGSESARTEERKSFDYNVGDTWLGRMMELFSQVFDKILLWPRWVMVTVGGVLTLLLATAVFIWPNSSAVPVTPAKDAQLAMQQRFVRLESDISRLIRDVAALPSTMRLELSSGLVKQRESINTQAGKIEAMIKDMTSVRARIGKAEALVKSPNSQIESQLRVIITGLDGVRQQMSKLMLRNDQFDTVVKSMEQRLVALELLGKRLSGVPSLQARGLSKIRIKRIRAAGEALISIAVTSQLFDKPLGVYGALAPGDPAVTLLAPYARHGAPTMEQLQQRARVLAAPKQIKTSKEPVEPGLLGKFVIWSEKFVRVRRKTDQREMRISDWDKLAGVLGTQGLEQGLRLAMAMPSGSAQDRWVKDAEARLLINRQLRLLKDRLDGLKAGNPTSKDS